MGDFGKHAPLEETMQSVQSLVLIVDDDPVQLGVIEQAFRTMEVPWETRFFMDPSDVLVELRKNPGALLVTDWMMPEMSGLELCHHVRDDSWHGKGFHYCILLTSRKAARDAVEALDEAHQYLVKPVDPQRLAQHIEAGLRFSYAPVPAEKVELAPGEDAHADAMARRAALRFLDAELDSVGPGKELSLFLCEPEGLLSVEGQFGPDVKEEILREWVQRVHSVLREEDQLIRWKGNCYLGICPQVSQTAMNVMAQGIRSTISRLPFRTGKGFFSGGICIGIASADSDELDSWTLLHQAEESLKEAISQGPGSIVAAEMVGAPTRH
jgi:diguanylate cyclase (GGDEF)-like protein